MLVMHRNENSGLLGNSEMSMNLINQQIHEDVMVIPQRAFLPTMPEDMLAVARQAMGPLQWYCEY